MLQPRIPALDPGRLRRQSRNHIETRTSSLAQGLQTNNPSTEICYGSMVQIRPPSTRRRVGTGMGTGKAWEAEHVHCLAQSVLGFQRIAPGHLPTPLPLLAPDATLSRIDLTDLRRRAIQSYPCMIGLIQALDALPSMLVSGKTAIAPH
eukprot:2219654-Rhodomonas_salina.1